MLQQITRRAWRPALLAAALTGAATAPLGAQARQTDTTFRWSERASAGQWLQVRNLNGNVRIESSNSDRIEVRAIKTWRRGDPGMVNIEVHRYGAGDRNVLVCATWGDDARCTEHEYRNRSSGRQSRNNDVSVDFVIAVPRGVNIRGSTVNGDLRVNGATEEVRVSTVNGNVNAVSSGGPVEARSVNGNVHARMGRLDGDEDISYGSVNGNVVVEFSGDLHAEVEMSTTNGGFETNFPLTVRGRLNPRHIRTTIGDGGRLIRLSTVNGNVELRRL